MGACKSRQKKTATTPSNEKLETPLITKSTKTKSNFQLRPDAQPYVPPYIVPDEKIDDEVKEPWEIFLEQKKKDVSSQQRGLLRRMRDGTYTGEYKSLLTRPPPGLGAPKPQWRHRSPSPDFDVRGAWRQAQKRAASPSKFAEAKVTKKRKPTALKKAILAQRGDQIPNELWAKFDAHVQKVNEKVDKKEVDDEPEATKVLKDDLAAPSALVPFGLSDRCYLSDSEDKKSRRHIEECHGPIREYVNMELTPELEAAVTETLFTLRQLRIQDMGLGLKTRRFAIGFREVSRLITQQGVACLVVAPDLERTAGALEGKIAALVKQCESQDVPVVFALSRRQLGQAICKNVTVSVLAIQETRGALVPFQRMLTLAQEARAQTMIQ